MFYINIIKSYRNVVAICDAELLGKNFEQGNIQLNIKKEFYSTPDAKPLTETETKKIMENLASEDSTFNIVGKHSVKLALELELVSEDSIREICEVPYTLVLM